jgi:transaldolase
VGRTVGVLKGATTNITIAAKEIGLTNNMQKTKYSNKKTEKYKNA